MILGVAVYLALGALLQIWMDTDAHYQRRLERRPVRVYCMTVLLWFPLLLGAAWKAIKKGTNR